MEIQLMLSALPALISKQSVLIIDDSLDSLFIGRALLEREGFNVFTASSGAEALQILEGSQEPDLILLDMQMEDMSGQVFLDILDEKKPHFLLQVPVVFYSAVNYAPLGKAAGFIRKAGDIDQFLAQVHSYIKLH